MARIRFDISAALSKWRARNPVASRRFRMMDLQALHEMTLGPGWFDSSWDLDQGLEVDVALPDDPAFAAWLEALSRTPEPAAGHVAAVLPVQEMLLEFEPVDWKAWAPPDLVADPLPACDPAGPDSSGLKLQLEMPGIEFEPALELALLPI
jgi:hypothetical protein